MLLLCRALADCLYEIRAVYQGKGGKKKKKIRQCHRALDSQQVTRAQTHSDTLPSTHTHTHTHTHTLLMTQTHNIKPNAATKICMVLSNALVNITWQSVHTGLIGF